MKRKRLFVLFLFLMLLAEYLPSRAQGSHKFVTIQYQVKVLSSKNNGILADNYHGATQTVFIGPASVRLRLVSAMRIQSTFYYANPSSDRAVYQLESGGHPVKKSLSEAGWIQSQKKISDPVCTPVNETATFLGYLCRKVKISFASGRSMTVYYSPDLRNSLFAAAQPMFACIPGIVLQYTIESKSAKLVYTAQKINFDEVDPAVFLPAR